MEEMNRLSPAPLLSLPPPEPEPERQRAAKRHIFVVEQNARQL